MIAFVISYLKSIWFLLIEMAPWLLLGFLVAGLLHVYFPKSKVEKWMGGSGFIASLKASIIGVPLPLCSCGVIPTAISFHKNGASKSSTVSFLISTPQTGVDSIAATYALMGGPFAILRPIIAIITGVLGGWLTKAILHEKKQTVERKNEETTPNYQDNTVGEKILIAFKYGFVTMMADILKWLVIGILIAAALSVLLPPAFFEQYIGNFWIELLVILLFSIPLYVCATGSIPIAVALLWKGLSPASAILFLMAGPATNVATMTVMGNALGKKAFWSYLISIVGGALLSAIFVHFFIPEEWFLKALPIMDTSSQHTYGWFSILSAIVLVGLMAYAFIRPKIKSNQIKEKTSDMRSIKFSVDGMTCNHCKMSVEKSVGQLPGVESVNASPQENCVEVNGETDLEEVKTTITNLGFTVND